MVTKRLSRSKITRNCLLLWNKWQMKLIKAWKVLKSSSPIDSSTLSGRIACLSQSSSKSMDYHTTRSEADSWQTAHVWAMNQSVSSSEWSSVNVKWMYLNLQLQKCSSLKCWTPSTSFRSWLWRYGSSRTTTHTPRASLRYRQPQHWSPFTRICETKREFVRWLITVVEWSVWTRTATSQKA